jgi:hypothetical protein
LRAHRQARNDDEERPSPERVLMMRHSACQSLCLEKGESGSR